MWSKMLQQITKLTNRHRQYRPFLAFVCNRQFCSTNSDIESNFRKALSAMTSSSHTPKNISDSTKLDIYALYKQSEVGPCSIPQPSMFDVVARAKYSAWKALGNMPQSEAKAKYVQLVANAFGGTIPAVGDGLFETKADQASAAKFDARSHYLSRNLLDILFPAKKHESNSTSFNSSSFESLKTTLSEEGVLSIQLDRPKRGNALNIPMLNELQSAFEDIKSDSNVRVVVLKGGNGNFSTGMDLTVFSELQSHLSGKNSPSCDGRRREGLMRFIQYLQDVVNSPEESAVPTIAAIHGSCIGGALDLVTACDLRFCTKDTTFSVKEIDLAIVS